jgi:hypothetical protein
MQKQLAEHRPDDVNLSTSRTPGGGPVIANSIPATDSPDNRLGDSGAKVLDHVAIAPLALTSRRGFLMNTMVSAATLATAAAVAAPTIVAAAPVGDVSFPDLVAQLVRVRERLNERRVDVKAWSDKINQLFFDATGLTNDERLAIDRGEDPRQESFQEIHTRLMEENPYWGDDDALDRLVNDLWLVVEAIVSRTPTSVADLAWQAEALVTADPEILSDLGEACYEGLQAQVFKNIRTLAGPLPLLGEYQAISAPAAIAADPIFAAIEAHRKACVTNTRCVDFERVLNPKDPAYRSASFSTSKARDAKNDLALELLKIRPTSLAGARALLDHVGDVEDIETIDQDWRFPDDDENGTPFHIAMIKHVADALGSTPAGDFAASDEPAADPDAALIELGAEYERLLAIEQPPPCRVGPALGGGT